MLNFGLGKIVEEIENAEGHRSPETNDLRGTKGIALDHPRNLSLPREVIGPDGISRVDHNPF